MSSPEQAQVVPLRKTARLCGALAVGLGILVLAGWSFDVASMKSVAPGFPPMKPITALVFALCGIAILARSLRSRAAALVSSACALTAGAAGLLTILEYTTRIPFSIDHLLFPGADHVRPIGRMAPLTAVNFVALALALFFLERARGRRARDVFVLLVALDSLLVLFAYVYRVSEVSIPGGFGSVALNTSIGFLAVCSGVLALRPEEGLAGRLVSDSFAGAIARRLLPAVLLVPLVLGWLRVVGEDRGFYDEGLGTALFAVAIVALLAVIVFWSAEQLSEAEARRARAEETVAREKSILKSILHSMGEAVIVADGEGRFVLFNPVAEQILGLGATDVPAGDWSAEYGLFLPDGSAPYPPQDLPLARAVRGESVDGAEVLVRSPSLPERIHLSVGRPLKDASGRICGGVVVFHDVTDERNAAAEREQLIAELTQALSEVKTLSGMLPICSSCKKIRDDKGYWNQIDSYLHDHSGAKFSHGICPECAKVLYPEYASDVPNEPPKS